MANIPTVKLQSGALVPALAYGIGTRWLKGPDSAVDQATTDSIKEAIGLGYRHLDGAQMYNTEIELGIALKDSGVPRSDFFLTTKAQKISDIEKSLEASLEKMQTDYVDLYLIHTPFHAKTKAELQSAWRAMEQCYDRGLARHIGLSNCTLSDLASVAEIARIKPSAAQVEMHPYVQQPKLISYLRDSSIVLEGYGPLAPVTKKKDGPASAPCKALAEKYGVTESAVLLRWVIDQGAVAVTTSSNKERLQGYLADISSFRLTGQEIDEITRVSESVYFRAFFADVFPTRET